MSDGSKFHRSDAATGKERRPTVVSRNGGTSSSAVMMCWFPSLIPSPPPFIIAPIAVAPTFFLRPLLPSNLHREALLWSRVANEKLALKYFVEPNKKMTVTKVRGDVSYGSQRVVVPLCVVSITQVTWVICTHMCCVNSTTLRLIEWLFVVLCGLTSKKKKKMLYAVSSCSGTCYPHEAINAKPVGYKEGSIEFEPRTCVLFVLQGHVQNRKKN